MISNEQVRLHPGASQAWREVILWIPGSSQGTSGTKGIKQRLLDGHPLGKRRKPLSRFY